MAGVVLDSCGNPRAGREAVIYRTQGRIHNHLLQGTGLAKLDRAEVHLGSKTSHCRWSKVLLGWGVKGGKGKPKDGGKRNNISTADMY